MLYYKKIVHLQECLHCMTPRYNLSANEDGKPKKGIIAKVLQYFPIILKL